MGAWAGAGCGGGLVAGLRVGLACGVLLLPGFGVSSSNPRFLGTQPPYATQVLMFHNHRNKKNNIPYHWHMGKAERPWFQ